MTTETLTADELRAVTGKANPKTQAAARRASSSLAAGTNNLAHVSAH